MRLSSRTRTKIFPEVCVQIESLFSLLSSIQNLGLDLRNRRLANLLNLQISVGKQAAIIRTTAKGKARTPPSWSRERPNAVTAAGSIARNLFSLTSSPLGRNR
jgi:hypothetical protein